MDAQSKPHKWRTRVSTSPVGVLRTGGPSSCEGSEVQRKFYVWESGYTRGPVAGGRPRPRADQSFGPRLVAFPLFFCRLRRSRGDWQCPQMPKGEIITCLERAFLVGLANLGAPTYRSAPRPSPLLAPPHLTTLACPTWYPMIAFPRPSGGHKTLVCPTP